MTKSPRARIQSRTRNVRAHTVNGGSADSEQSRRAEEAIRLLDEWMADDSGYDEETWPKLRAALEADRLSSRRLFDDEARPA